MKKVNTCVVTQQITGEDIESGMPLVLNAYTQVSRKGVGKKREAKVRGTRDPNYCSTGAPTPTPPKQCHSVALSLW